MPLSPAQIEKIITEEIEVDCYDEYEVQMGWFLYLSEQLNYPFEAEYHMEQKGKKPTWKKVRVIDTASIEEDFNGQEFYVKIEVEGLVIPAGLSKLRKIKGDDGTLNTLQVWEYSKA